MTGRKPSVRSGGTLGVEEEFYLVDARTRLPVAAADIVLPSVRERGVAATSELTPLQIELQTPVCHSLADVATALARGRRALAASAAEHGLGILASGTPVLDAAPPPPLSAAPRYSAMLDRFGALLNGQGTCGLHVHVGVPDREEAVRLCGHLRPWLACLLAISANSPFSSGHDTRYESWRAVLATRWPTVTPPPVLSGVAAYESTLERLQRYGTALSPQGVFWWARPSPGFATVEIRVADTQPTTEDTLLLTALTRALVLEALDAVRRNAPVPDVDDLRVNAMLWRAARYGMDGSLIHPETDDLVPAPALFQQLCSQLRSRLERLGDWDTVSRLSERLLSVGSGARRQRTAAEGGGRLRDAVDAVSVPGRRPLPSHP
ncbi:glutamate--cysteine ligase [Streptomyces sp. cmx-18-6]|uniref:carboxylate-amine ligase n=1 Tax=Streptomyces sp. cmx-18-6 TaxID=2790930 RepID=UPI00397F374B